MIDPRRTTFLVSLLLVWWCAPLHADTGDAGMADVAEDTSMSQDTSMPMDTEMPPEDTEMPPEDTMMPPEDTEMPPEDTEMPPEDTAMPPEDTEMPPEDTEMPPEDTAMPPEDTMGQMGDGRGLTGVYYNNVNFGNQGAVRVDAPIDFDWSNNAVPVNGIDPPNNYSVRWTGQIIPQYTELFTLHTISDDGVRLWVNGELLIDNWTGHAATENTGSIPLVEGQPANVVLDYYQGGGGATIQLLWSSASQVREHIPGSQMEADTPVLQQEPMVGIKTLDPSMAEGSPPNSALIVLWRWGRLDNELTVNLTYEGTAINGQDYTAADETFTFAANQSAARIEIAPIDDDEEEGDESMTIALAPGSGYNLAELSSAEITLGDDESPGLPPTWSITGNISYSGERTGPFVVSAYSDAALTAEVASYTAFAPGIYSISNLNDGTYYIAGFLDEDENGQLDDGEITLTYTEGDQPVALTMPPDAFNIDMPFTDPKGGEEGCGCTSVHRPAPSRPPLGLLAVCIGAVGLGMWRRMRHGSFL
ncbi:MAG: PA14 domain-containing protein [Myxococcota bacterium]